MQNMAKVIGADWWKCYPDSNGRHALEPGGNDMPDPRLPVGTMVRLCGKPDKARRILSLDWHRYRYRYVYKLETSGGDVPYWFADQLILEGESQPILELSQQRALDTVWHKLKVAIFRD